MHSNSYVPQHPGAAAVLLVAGLMVLIAFPLATEEFFPDLSGFALGWASFLAGIPLLSAAIVVALADAPSGTFAWMAALALPVFIVGALLHLAISNALGTDEPVILIIAQIGPPVLLCSACFRLLLAGIAAVQPRILRWRQQAGGVPYRQR